jgi:hypothetical protein
MIQSCEEIPQIMKMPKYGKKRRKAGYEKDSSRATKQSQHKKPSSDSGNSMREIT